MSKARRFAAAIMISAAGIIHAQAGQPQTIVYWTPFTGGDGKFFDEMVATFNKSQKAIVLVPYNVKFESYYPKLTDALAAGTAPDLLVLHLGHLQDYAPSGPLLPLNDLAQREGLELSDFGAGPIKDCRFGGELFAVPLDVHPIVMFYNKDLLAKAGVAKLPRSLEELYAAAKAVQTKTGVIGIAADNTTANYKAYTLARVFLSFLMQEGVSVLDSGNKKANFNNAAGIKAYQALSDMVNKLGITPRGLDYDFSVQYFREGKAAFHLNGAWVTGLFESQEGLNFGAVEFPPAFGKPMSWSDLHVFAIPSRKDGDQAVYLAAMKAIDWMTAHGELWARAGHIPTRKSVLKKPDFLALPNRAALSSAVEHSFTPPRIPKWPQCYIAISDGLERAIAQNRDARSALAEIEKTVNGILSSR